MAKIYKSKLGLELILPIVAIVGTVAVITLLNKTNWAGLIILFAPISFIIHLFLTTRYTIDEHLLKIKCGFLYNKQIDINAIKKISETNNPLSSPATSLDRLEITYNQDETVLISPKQKREFISTIKELNPSIEIKLKTTNKF